MRLWKKSKNIDNQNVELSDCSPTKCERELRRYTERYTIIMGERNVLRSILKPHGLLGSYIEGKNFEWKDSDQINQCLE